MRSRARLMLGPRWSKKSLHEKLKAAGQCVDEGSEMEDSDFEDIEFPSWDDEDVGAPAAYIDEENNGDC